MEEKKFMEALEDLKSKLEGSTNAQIEKEVKAFEEKYNDVLASMTDFSDKLEDIKNGLNKIEDVQKHVDKLDVKLQSKTANPQNEDFIKKAVKDNFDSIAKVRKGSSFKTELKAVGNMTIGAIGNYGGLTGDQPRTYNFDVVSTPGQLINVSDLVGVVNIANGTYTYVRETGTEGSISAQTEGSSKSQIDYDFSMLDVNTDFIAGFATYSKKMANNLPFLESWLPTALRRDYAIAENTAFNTTLANAATASAEVITGQNKVEMLIGELATLEGSNYMPNGICVRPADWYDILITEKSTGAGYGLPGIVTFDGGVLRVNGIPVYKVNWIAANKYYVGDWSRIKKVVTEGLSLDFSEHEGNNFTKNLITARIEAQVALAVEQPAAIIYGDFTTT